MTRTFVAVWAFVILYNVQVSGLDLPFNLGFQLGFSVHAIPGPGDLSQELGLQVTTEAIRTDKQRMLAISGSISNWGDVPRDNVTMDFAVTSYIATGYSHGRATVEPSSIPPGGTARFSAYIFLQSDKPRFALYTVGASPAGEILLDESIVTAP